MSICPVCGEIQNADQRAFAYHVNSHFEAGKSTSMSSPEKYGPTREISDQTTCPICDFPLSFLSPNIAQSHINTCLDDSSTSHQRTSNILSQDLDPDECGLDYDYDSHFLSDMQNERNRSVDAVDEEWDGPAKPGGWMGWAGKKVQKGDEWWDPINGSISEIPSNFSPGVIPVLAEILRKSSRRGTTRRAVLCRDVTHIKGQWKFDMGWGCGFRNSLMSLSSLLSIPAYQTMFDPQSNGAEPGIRRAQGWIQEAWEEGFDPLGREQLRGKVLGTRKWIGPSEMYAMFSYQGIPCGIYDFPKPVNLKGKRRLAHIALRDWVVSYFPRHVDTKHPQSAFDVMMRTAENGAGRGEVVRISNKFPLILQHSGHSRTIIGYEENSRGDINLLLFDPARSMPKSIRSAGIAGLIESRQKRPSLSQDSTQSSSMKPSKPNMLKKKSSSITKTHESIPFSPPYTNGRAEINYDSSFEMNEQVPHQRGGGLILEDDEEMISGGWVRKRIKKFNLSNHQNEVINDNYNHYNQQIDTLKPLTYFRESLSNLSKFNNYQILAFTGGPILTQNERDMRKISTSTVFKTEIR
uniref:UFSP1/2/DUB catalytic domain-containing protein n=1 Tax=Kwoniella pini CBS 10737 TaxID=1296096 RepID=A0A1B9I0E5_9TREE|nr:uncharacterized protein I206_04703 [Kwoniella pini CBS 10737]OCF49016.1 hypothetical protein I206_04703 [Kwoniella pini CBS 10737]